MGAAIGARLLELGAPGDGVEPHGRQDDTAGRRRRPAARPRQAALRPGSADAVITMLTDAAAIGRRL